MLFPIFCPQGRAGLVAATRLNLALPDQVGVPIKSVPRQLRSLLRQLVFSGCFNRLSATYGK
jgi:hypothetical protein